MLGWVDGFTVNVCQCEGDMIGCSCNTRGCMIDEVRL